MRKNRLRVVLVDDEPLARRALREVLASDVELEVVAECVDGEDALQAIRQHRPELVLLDIQMPEMNGFEVLRRLDGGPSDRSRSQAESLPCIVFVTAYDEHAVQAFEKAAIDYVLKPFSEARLRQALERAKERVRSAELSDLARRVLALAGAPATTPATTPATLPGWGPIESTPTYLERLAVPKGARTLLLQVDQIDWLEAADYHVRLHVGDHSHLIRKPLKWFEQQLDPACFVRVHRSAIVHLRRVSELRRLGPDDYVAILPGERQVALSRAGREALGRLLG